MTQDEIIEMADKCGLMGYFELDGDSVGQLGLVAFAKLIAAKEREACAKFIEDEYVRQFENPWREDLAAAIRERGKT